jgi:hypothetical protein
MNAKVSKPEYIRELGSVDITEIEALVSRIPDAVWDMEDSRKENAFRCFHHTRHIIFRFIEGFRDHRVFYSTPIWHLCHSTLLPIFDQVVATYGLSRNAYPKVMLARLAAGHTIDAHVDGGGPNLFTHKIHIPIQTNDKVRFFVRNRAFRLRRGIAYEVNNLATHGVENAGETDRIHLIFEVFDAGTD